MNSGPLTELRRSGTSSDASGEEPANIGHVLPPKDKEKPPPLRSILTRPVIISISSYGMLAFLLMAVVALIPLVWSTPVELGGLGLSPASIGLWMSGFGCTSGIFQYVCFPPLISRFGPRTVFLTSVSMCVLVYTMFPFENLALRHASSHPNVAEKLLIILQLWSFSIAQMGYSKSIPFSRPQLRAGTEKARVHQAPHTCILLLQPPTGDRWAQQTALRKWWWRHNVCLDPPQRTPCLRFP